MLGVLAFALGASVGSFVNVVADRLPIGRSLIRPRSVCQSCNRPIASLDLLPVFSYLWLRGRCRYCGGVIPARALVVEAIAGLLFTVVYARYGLGTDFVIIVGGISLLLVISLIDLERCLILSPNPPMDRDGRREDSGRG